MAKKTTKIRPWTKDDVRTLKTLAREGTQTTVIARKLKRSVQATYQKASALAVASGEDEKRERDGQELHSFRSSVVVRTHRAAPAMRLLAQPGNAR